VGDAEETDADEEEGGGFGDRRHPGRHPHVERVHHDREQECEGHDTGVVPVRAAAFECAALPVICVG
jgi:hypothetical protein